MILEVAILNVTPGRETQFETDFATAGQHISQTRGYIKHSLNKCLEQKSKYLLLVEWERLEDHTEGSDSRRSTWSGKNYCIITMIRSRWLSIM